MWSTIIFYFLVGVVFSTYGWLIWDIAHWLPKDMVGEKDEN